MRVNKTFCINSIRRQKGRIADVQVKVANKVLAFKIPANEIADTLELWMNKYNSQQLETSKAESSQTSVWNIETGLPRNVGERVKHYRLLHGWSQAALAQKAETTQASISNVEKGNAPIGKAMAEKLGRVFAVDYRVFL